MIEATERREARLCTACFNGIYPIELPSADRWARSARATNRSRLWNQSLPDSARRCPTAQHDSPERARSATPRRGRRRGWRPGGRADEGVGRQGPQTQGDRRGRRFRRAVRRLGAAEVPQAVLATSTDGVGTKVAIAQAMDCTTPSASTWSAWSSTTLWSSARNRCS